MWNTREIYIKYDIYPWNMVITREIRSLPKENNNPISRLEYIFFAWLYQLHSNSLINFW